MTNTPRCKVIQSNGRMKKGVSIVTSEEGQKPKSRDRTLYSAILLTQYLEMCSSTKLVYFSHVNIFNPIKYYYHYTFLILSCFEMYFTNI